MKKLLKLIILMKIIIKMLLKSISLWFVTGAAIIIVIADCIASLAIIYSNKNILSYVILILLASVIGMIVHSSINLILEMLKKLK